MVSISRRRPADGDSQQGHSGAWSSWCGCPSAHPHDGGCAGAHTGITLQKGPALLASALLAGSVLASLVAAVDRRPLLRTLPLKSAAGHRCNRASSASDSWWSFVVHCHPRSMSIVEVETLKPSLRILHGSSQHPPRPRLACLVGSFASSLRGDI